jgi:hypothetical protein
MPIRQEDEQEDLTEFRIFVDGGDGEEDGDETKVAELRKPLQALRPTIGSNQKEHNGFDFADSFLYMEMRKLKRATSGSYQLGRYTPSPSSFTLTSNSPLPAYSLNFHSVPALVSGL